MYDLLLKLGDFLTHGLSYLPAFTLYVLIAGCLFGLAIPFVICPELRLQIGVEVTVYGAMVLWLAWDSVLGNLALDVAGVILVVYLARSYLKANDVADSRPTPLPSQNIAKADSVKN